MAAGVSDYGTPSTLQARNLGTQTQKQSGVEPQHYRLLIEMIVGSADWDDFSKRSETPKNVWRDIARADEIHLRVLSMPSKSQFCSFNLIVWYSIYV